MPQPNSKRDTKTCTSCYTSLPKNQFYVIRAKGVFGYRLQASCKECTRHKNRITHEKRAEDRKGDLRRRVRQAITNTLRDARRNKNCPCITSLSTIMGAWTGRCSICKQAEDISIRKKLLCLDHCHKTGMFRGWLCTRCNSVLGYVNDDVELLSEMIIFLELYKGGV